MQGAQSSQLCQQIYVTGGGAYKYSELIESKLGLTVVRIDEMASICSGANFLLTNIVEESFLYDRSLDPHYMFQPVKTKDALFPYLLVTIGSGVSVIKVDSETRWEVTCSVQNTIEQSATTYRVLSCLLYCRE